MNVNRDTSAKRKKGSDYLESRFREKLLEHVFIAELLQEVWLGKGETMEVLRSEIDTSGYDLVLDCRGVIRYVQLKSSRSGAKTARQTVNSRLAEKLGACVIWMVFQECDRRVNLQYLVLGGGPEQELELGIKKGKHPRANATGLKTERPNTRVISKSIFTKLQTTGELVSWLFERNAID